jgi:hypothetical protein
VRVEGEVFIYVSGRRATRVAVTGRRAGRLPGRPVSRYGPNRPCRALAARRAEVLA